MISKLFHKRKPRHFGFTPITVYIPEISHFSLANSLKYHILIELSPHRGTANTCSGLN